MKKKELKVLVVGAEAIPYASVGGLSRFIYHLPRALKRQGVDARIFMPKYGKIDTDVFNMELEVEGIEMPESDFEKRVTCNVLSHVSEDGVKTYFLENQEYYELRANEYGYIDDHIRWGLLQRGLWEFLKVSDWVPDIIHCNDWQTGLIPNYHEQYYKKDKKLSKIRTVFTMHNLRYQAPYDHMFVTEMDFDAGKSELPPIVSPKFERLNSLRRGIIYSTSLTTVSPTYVKEILTTEYGEALERLLNEVKFKLHGILNGIDYDDFNTQTDPNLHVNFAPKELEKRADNKLFIQERFMLEKNPDVPMFIIVSRLSEQKGLPLINEIIETVLNEFNAQLVVNGDGETGFKSFFRYLSEKYPSQVGVNLVWDEKLPRVLLAGGDFLLHPSRYEPGGIVQIEAMRYGCIPIVREVGCLADTVFEGDNGFTFKKYTSQSLLMTISRAVEVFKHKDLITNLRISCMKKDFSWNNSAKDYIKLYKSTLNSKSNVDINQAKELLY